jgi:hypothetical protein
MKLPRPNFLHLATAGSQAGARSVSQPPTPDGLDLLLLLVLSLISATSSAAGSSCGSGTSVVAGRPARTVCSCHLPHRRRLRDLLIPDNHRQQQYA